MWQKSRTPQTRNVLPRGCRAEHSLRKYFGTIQCLTGQAERGRHRGVLGGVVISHHVVEALQPLQARRPPEDRPSTSPGDHPAHLEAMRILMLASARIERARVLLSTPPHSGTCGQHQARRGHDP
jgi:hypothetical protein